MNKKGILVVVSGPSGAGKGTICEEYIKTHDNCSLSISATTRKPRPGEIDGVNYYFISENDFVERVQNDGFLEHAVFCGNMYGTPKDAVLKMIESGKDVILEIEVQGAMQVRSHYPEGVFVFVVPPTMQELENRLRGRNTEDEEKIKLRLSRARQEFDFVEKYNYILENDTVGGSVKKLQSIIEAEKCRLERNYESITKEFKS